MSKTNLLSQKEKNSFTNLGFYERILHVNVTVEKKTRELLKTRNGATKHFNAEDKPAFYHMFAHTSAPNVCD